jgi:quercetin dioxygenase-like cupin family protein
MKRVAVEEVEIYGDEKYACPVLFKGERATTLLLCLKPGQAIPAHRHEGFEVTLHPLKGEAETVLDGEQVWLRAGEMIFVGCSACGRATAFMAPAASPVYSFRFRC